MERYIVQKAQQALEALTTEDSLENRLRLARLHLSFPTDGNYFGSMTPEVRRAYHNYLSTSADEPRPTQAQVLRLLLMEIFEADGRETVNGSP